MQAATGDEFTRDQTVREVKKEQNRLDSRAAFWSLRGQGS